MHAQTFLRATQSTETPCRGRRKVGRHLTHKLPEDWSCWLNGRRLCQDDRRPAGRQPEGNGRIENKDQRKWTEHQRLRRDDKFLKEFDSSVKINFDTRNMTEISTELKQLSCKTRFYKVENNMHLRKHFTYNIRYICMPLCTQNLDISIRESFKSSMRVLHSFRSLCFQDVSVLMTQCHASYQ